MKRLLLIIFCFTVYAHAAQRPVPVSENMRTIINDQRQTISSIGSISDAIWHEHLFEDIALVKQFIKMGIDLDQLNRKGYRPLALAAGLGRRTVVELLLTSGASIDKPNMPDENTALMEAVRGDRVETAQFLLNAKANVNAKNVNGSTPLMFAIGGYASAADPSCLVREEATAERREITRLLLSAGANVHIRNNDGLKASDIARDPEILSLLPLRAPQCAEHSVRIVSWASKVGIKSGTSKQKPGNIFKHIIEREAQLPRRVAYSAVAASASATILDSWPTRMSIEYARKLAKLKLFAQQQQALVYCPIHQSI